MTDLNTVTVKLKGKDFNFILNERSKDKPFSTGSTGFYGQGKIEVSATEKYQVSCIVTLIGSRPKKE